MLGEATTMKTVTVKLRSKGKAIRVREYEAAPRNAPDSFYTVQVTEMNRRGKAVQSMTFTPESADALRRALNALESDLTIERSLA
jgi:hypothetical protein